MSFLSTSPVVGPLRALPASLALGLLLTACNSGSTSSDKAATDTSAEAPAAAATPASPPDSPGTWYRQYRGVLPGSSDSITVQLHRLPGNAGETALGRLVGTYAGPDGHPYDLAGDVRANGDSLSLRDTSPDAVGASEDEEPQWRLQQQGTTLVGTRNGQPVRLRQVQPPVGVQFASKSFTATVPARPNQPQDTIVARFALQTLVPVAGAGKQAIAEAVLRGLRGDTVDTKPVPTLDELWQNQLRYFTTEYQKEVGPLVAKAPKATADYRPLATLAYEQESNTYVLWNDGKLLSLGFFGYDYSGGAHGMYATEVRSYDAQTGRQLRYNDIFRAGTKKQLEGLLGQYARPALDLQPGQPLSEALFENTLPVTRNVYLTSGGAVFVYAPYEVASYAQGEIKVFVPFSALQPLLQPGLPVGSGGAVAAK